jgi:ribA/ribD-fused uncharacterized protein
MPVPDEIRFYRASEKPFGIFSNLYRRAMEFEGVTLPTAEHCYQRAKPRDDDVRAWLMQAPSPSLLAMAAHGLLSWDISPGWSKNRRGRMRAVVTAKFRQHADLAEILIGTGDARIVEFSRTNNEVNRRWGEVEGIGGHNWLGLILCEVREDLRSRPPSMSEAFGLSPALAHRSRLYPESFGGRVPKVVRMLETVRMSLPFLILTADRDIPYKAEAGGEYPAWVNSDGVVSAVIGTDEYGKLRLKPGEFEVVEWWEPSNA